MMQTQHLNHHQPLLVQQQQQQPQQQHQKQQLTCSESNIVNFYQNRSILITGGSGFIGKVLIEKLLRTCPNIRHIFMLIRPKWNKQPKERLQDLLKEPLFRGIDSEKLNEKVIVVEGDVTRTNLGLSEQNLLRIMNEVSVIYHSAATVKFDEPLKQSIAINIAGTKNMIDLCRKIPQLAALVHVSTAYANCDKDEIDEYIYPAEMNPEKLIEMANWLDQDTLQELKKRLLGERPNTYTYTKALAEWLLVKCARDLPVVICRPSIVIASWKEPFSGWIDNVNGPTGIVLGAGKGLIRTMYAQSSFVADLIPVDVVINLVITLGWFANVYRNHKQLNDAAESLTESLINSSNSSSTGGDYDEMFADNFTTTTKSLIHQNTNQIDNSRKPSDRTTEQTVKGDNDLNNGDKSYCNNNNNNNNNNTNNNSSNYNHTFAEIANGTKTTEQVNQNQNSKKSHYGNQLLTTTTTNNIDLNNTQHDDGYEGSISAQLSPTTSIGSSPSSSPPPRLVKKHQQTGKSLTSTLTNKPITSVNTTINDDDENNSSSSSNNNNNNNNNQNGASFSYEAQHRLAQQNHADFEYKLKQFRHNTKVKLSAKNLPEEIVDIPVFHCTSGDVNPITWGRVQVIILSILALYPSITTYRYPCGAFTNNKCMDEFYRITLHYFPGYLVDLFTKLFGGKPVLIKIFRKFDQAANVLKAFTSKQWKFKSDNRLMLINELMSDEDRRLFNCDMKPLDWNDYLKDYVLGVREFMLKEPISNLEQARTNLKIVYYRNLSIQVLLISTIGYYFTRILMHTFY